MPFRRMKIIFFHVIFILSLQPPDWWYCSSMLKPVKHVFTSTCIMNDVSSHFACEIDQAEPCCHKGWYELLHPVNYQKIFFFDIFLLILHVLNLDICNLTESLSLIRRKQSLERFKSLLVVGVHCLH